MKILVIGPSWVGDMVMSQSLYQTLKNQDPSCQIDVLAPLWCRPILSFMPEVNRIIEMPIGHGSLQLPKRRQLGHSLRQESYDQAIVLPGSLKSALIPWFAGIKKRTGWLGEMRYGLLNDYRKLDKQAFPLMVERYIALAFDKSLNNASQLPQPLFWPQLKITPEKSKQAQTALHLSPQRPTLAICPGAEFGPAKRWPHYHYAQLCSMIIEKGWQVVIFGSKNDQTVGKSIETLIDSHQGQHVYNLAGKTQLQTAVELMSSCQAVVTNDSGLMHVAAAVGLPLVALYGPSSPDFTPPLSSKAKVIRLIDGYHKIRKGEGEHGYHQSLIDIAPETVLNALDVLLSQTTDGVNL
jgi:heptosyltransferase-2